MMNIQSNISREIFAPQDQKLLVAIEVKKRRKQRLPFLTAGRKRDYVTFLCLSVTNKRPSQVFITKVKQYPGSPRFTKRSQWSVEQLRRVDGINPNKDTPEFDLGFDHNHDQWVAGSSAEKCMFVQILYHACQNYWVGRHGAAGNQKGPGASGEQPDVAVTMEKKKAQNVPQPTEFVNCQSKLMGDACSVNMVIYRCKIFLNRMKSTMIASPGQLQITGLKAPTSKASATKASTSKASTSKASSSKASTAKALTVKASTAKARSTKMPKPVASPPAERGVGSVVRRASHVLSDRDFRLARQVVKPRSNTDDVKYHVELSEELTKVVICAEMEPLKKRLCTVEKVMSKMHASFQCFGKRTDIIQAAQRQERAMMADIANNLG